MSPLTPQQVSQLTQELQQQRKMLIGEIRQALMDSEQEHLMDLAENVHDRGDESVADQLIDSELALVDNQTVRLREVEEALLRIRLGGYGECQACGCEIAQTRLQAYPAALRCVACQEKVEVTIHPASL